MAKGPAPPVTRPTDILNCDYNRAPLYELDGQGRYTTCGGLIAEVNCEFKAGFLAPAGMDLPSGNVCERGVRGTRDITYNRERLLSARFWQETGCPMEGLHIGEDAELASKHPVDQDGKTRFLVAGCGQERRYACDGEGARASPFRCAEVSPRIRVLRDPPLGPGEGLGLGTRRRAAPSVADLPGTRRGRQALRRQLTEARAKENQPTRTRLGVRGTCPMPGSGAPEPMEFPLVCSREAAAAENGAPGPVVCEVEAERWRHVQESRAFATANFAQDFRCDAGQIRVTDHQEASGTGPGGGVFRRVKVVGCGNNATYTCGKKERDGSPVTCAR